MQFLETGERRILESLGNASYARYVRTGHLVFAGASQSMAVPFGLDRLQPTGSPVPAIADVQIGGSRAAH